MSLETKIGSINIRNPLILASGIMGISYSTLQRIYNAGVGAVVSRSITLNNRKGNPNPSVFALNDIRSVVHSVGFANPGYQAFRKDLEKLVENEVPSIVSIVGENEDEFCIILNGLKDLPILAFELNMGLIDKDGLQTSMDSEAVYRLIRKLKSETKKPIWVKLTPNVNNFNEIAEAAVKADCDVLVAINPLKAMVIDIQTRQPILGSKKGELSGAGIKPIGVRTIYDLYENFQGKIPLIGVGGIMRGEDVIEYLLAGASAVQIGTALGVAFPENMIKFFLSKITRYMKEHNYSNVNEITGGAHK